MPIPAEEKPHLLLCLDVIGLVRDKWSLLLLNRLSHGPLRFSELRRRAKPISQKMLTHSLREMERYGLVDRDVLPAMPPQVIYGLTPLGASFLDTVGGICRWTISNVRDIEEAITGFDARGAQAEDGAQRPRSPEDAILLKGRSPADHAFADLVMRARPVQSRA